MATVSISKLLAVGVVTVVAGFGVSACSQEQASDNPNVKVCNQVWDISDNQSVSTVEEIREQAKTLHTDAQAGVDPEIQQGSKTLLENLTSPHKDDNQKMYQVGQDLVPLYNACATYRNGTNAESTNINVEGYFWEPAKGRADGTDCRPKLIMPHSIVKLHNEQIRNSSYAGAITHPGKIEGEICKQPFSIPNVPLSPAANNFLMIVDTPDDHPDYGIVSAKSLSNVTSDNLKLNPLAIYAGMPDGHVIGDLTIAEPPNEPSPTPY